MMCCLASCGGSDYRAPVEDRRMKPVSAPSTYTVQRGDTLYSITWRYGLDYRTIAAANEISSPYIIYPGQKLYLKKPFPKKKTAARSTVTTTSRGSANATTKTVATTKPKASAGNLTTSNTKVSSWRWPTKGKITRGYSSTVHKGIDISGAKGDAIYAVAPGKVVYAGTGIVGFGELLIVKHNDIYLSAYGHNYRLFVEEGDWVKAGQKIAEKGSSGTDTVKLHFEIRKEGKPIDPQKLLP